MSTIQPSGSVQDLARTLMKTFEANRDAKHTAEDFSTFLGRLLTGVSASDSATSAPAAPAATTTQAPVRPTGLRFEGLAPASPKA